MKILSVNVGRALVRPQINEKSAGGIIFAPTSELSLVVGEVLLVGPPRTVNGEETSIPLRPGFKVYFDRMGSTKVKNENNEELLIIRQEDVIAVVEGT